MTEVLVLFGQLSIGAIVMAIMALWMCYAFCLVAYRLFFHPLAKYPGPRLAAATKWYEFYFDIMKRPGGQFFKELDRIHDEYAWFDTLYAPNPTKRDKDPPAAEMAGLAMGTHGTVNHDLHRKRRLAISPLFSDRAVTSAQKLVHRHVRKLAANFEKMVNSNEPLDLQTTFLAYTTDIIYDYMFDTYTDYQSDQEAALNWRHSMEAVAQATPWFKQFPWLNKKLLMLPFPILSFLLSKVLPEIVGLLSTHKVMAKVVDDFLAARDLDKDQNGDNRIRPTSLFHAIVKSNLPGHEKAPERLIQEGLTVLFAGGETPSRVLAHTVYQLLDNPNILAEVKTEIRGTAKDTNRIPDLNVLKTLPWLTASVRESLRLRAATTSRLPLVSQKALVYKTWVIPAGTAVSMSHPDILHNEDVFPEALKFKPDRWFTATERQNKLFVPFGKGTRMCIGMEFAYAEIYISLATILSRFELQLHDTTWERDVKYTRDCFLGEPGVSSTGIRVKVISDNGKFKLPSD